MSPASWNALSEEDQKILTEAMGEVERSERALSRRMDQEVIQTLESKGMEVTYPDKAPFVAQTQSVRERFGENFKDILARIETAGKAEVKK